MKYPNFYETVKEANMRLRGTVVLYDGVPHYVHGIADNKPDGIFRAFIQPVDGTRLNFSPMNDYPPDHPSFGALADAAVGQEGCNVLRKQMNSPLFDKFRPFPLGMMNIDGHVYYVERQPTRRTEQGLSRAMLQSSRLTCEPEENSRGPARDSNPDILGRNWEPFRDCIVNAYPTAAVCISKLQSTDVSNTAAAFHREFAIVRGPIDTLFLAHRHKVVASLPDGNLSEVRLSRKYVQSKETIEELRLFGKVVVK